MSKDLFAGTPPSLPPAAPFLPMSRAEMAALGWEQCDLIIVTGDAYIDHPSFGMALVGRLLEAQGFKVGVIAQPDWRSKADFQALGPPRLYFGVTAGNMDSMVNHYTSDRRLRSDDAYSPDGEAGRRPDRALLVYAQRCREAYPGVPVILGGIEASLRRIAHYDYWSDKVRRSALVDAKAEMLIFGNAERALVEVSQRLAAGEDIRSITEVRGTAIMRRGPPEGWTLVDASRVDRPGNPTPPEDPYAVRSPGCNQSPPSLRLEPLAGMERSPRSRTCLRLPSYEQVVADPVLYAQASRVLHLETNPGNARALLQGHGDRDVWLNPPPWPLTTVEMDRIYELPYARRPHPSYGAARLPAWEMIRFSVTIMRGCFGGCTFCSITEHEGRIIQSRSEASVVREIGQLAERTPGYTGVISDLGGPTANMYRLACRDPRIEAACRRLSCVHPGICPNLNTDHEPLIRLYRRVRRLPEVRKVFIASGVRYDLAVRSPDYVRELASEHVGGYLKIAPEHTEPGPLAAMMKPGLGAYEAFKELFDRYSREAGKEQYLIPYFISAHPGTRDEDMLQLALWLKRNRLRLDQVQAFLPTPLALATAMYHSGLNPLRPIRRDNEPLYIPRGERQRRLHKALLRYHDPENWPLLRSALKRMGRADLIGRGQQHLVPPDPSASRLSATQNAVPSRSNRRR